MYHKEVNEVLAELNTSYEGLKQSVAKKKLETDGKNIINSVKPTPKWLKFLYQFKDILIIILIISALVSIGIAIATKSSEDFLDAGVIIFVVIINAVVGFIQENKADADMEKLKNLTKPTCSVIRDGKMEHISTEHLVVGDIVVLEAGNIVPADLRLIEAYHMKIEESAITGESVPVEKQTAALKDLNLPLGDRTNMAYMGTVVSYGHGLGVVTATGRFTEMGKIADVLGQNTNERTNLQTRIDKTSKILSIVTVVVCIVIFLLFTFVHKNNAMDAFVVAISIAVSAIPEALPTSMTITMALGVKRMSKERAIVRKLSAIESLGSTQVICSDKTGTLTLNKMTVKEVFNFGKEKDTPSNELIRTMTLCNDTITTIEDDKISDFGDPTETALVQYARLKGFEKNSLDGLYPRVNEIPFDSDRKLMSTINTVDGINFSHTKGAVDNIISRCKYALVDGKVVDFTDKLKDEVLRVNRDFCSRALRVLGYAIKKIKEDPKDIDINATEKGMTFVGLTGMIDPPRSEVKDAVKECKTAGIRVTMITGDHKDTAFAIAKELGICKDISHVITGNELNEMSDEKLRENIFDYNVFARVSPEHKVRIVEAYKYHNMICAMTGDGVNDAPSLKRADIGIGMGITGTDVTKDVSDIILTDDNFATITTAVKEGRTIYQNTLNIIQYLMQTCMCELIILGIIVGVLGEQLFSPALLLWNNFVSDSFPAMSLGVERPDKDIMRRAPNTSKKNLFSGVVGLNILVGSLIQAGLMFVVFFVSRDVFHCPHEEVVTLCFLAMALIEIFHAFNMRSSENSLFKIGLFSNKYMWLANGASVALTLLFIVVPIKPLQAALGICTLNGYEWLFVLGISISIIPIWEIYKAIKKLIVSHKNKKLVPTK